MGAGASAPTGAGSSPAPVVAPPVSTPIATPTATPSSTPQGGKGGPTTAGAAPTTPPPVTPSVSPVAPTAPQQPYVNPYMQTYGQNNTPQQQAFNRFQPQQYGNPYGRFGQGFPQQGNFGQQRGFMPQNRGGYERQMDRLRGQGQYGQQQGAQQAARYISPEERNAQDAYFRQDALVQAGRPRFSNLPSMDAGFGDPRNFNFGATPALNTQADSVGAVALGQPATGQTQIPSYAQPYATSLANQPNTTPAGGKGGNPTVTGTQTNGLYDPGYM